VSANTIEEVRLVIEPATPASIAPFGIFVGAGSDVPIFAQWSGVTAYGTTPVDIGSGGELLHVVMAASAFPNWVRLLERHFKHTQTYLAANAKPFVMVLGTGTVAGLPNLSNLRAFLFKDGTGIVMNAGTWHEFPVALQDDTRFHVVLREESHVNEIDSPEYPMDARGPDLERFDMSKRAEITFGF
jgi:ureidoglycolate lyase